MKVLFLSRDITHHLIPFFHALFRYFGEENCTFVVTEQDTYRAQMGFPKFLDECIFEAYNHTDDEYVELWNNSDIIITRLWDRPQLVKTALKKRKLVFYASERWYRPPIGIKRLLFPKYIKKYLDFRCFSNYSNFFYLAMGYYAGRDFQKVGLCKNRIFSFGYFTPENEYVQSANKSECIKIIWVGNMLTLKRVIDLLYVYNQLYQKYNICLELIGQGEERINLERYVQTHKIENVTFYNFLPNKEVKEKMSHADIYVFPSSGYEGWGAVINEAMQSKCAVIAAQETGAARSMIVNEQNGLTYPSGDREALRNCLERLLQDKQLLNKLKEEGFKTITELWSANEAARRFFEICKRIKHGYNLNIYKEGPFELI